MTGGRQGEIQTHLVSGFSSGPTCRYISHSYLSRSITRRIDIQSVLRARTLTPLLRSLIKLSEADLRGRPNGLRGRENSVYKFFMKNKCAPKIWESLVFGALRLPTSSYSSFRLNKHPFKVLGYLVFAVTLWCHNVFRAYSSILKVITSDKP